jgi:hypothetical protein
MKIARLIPLTIVATLGAGAVSAQSTQPNFALPKAYSGYTQPESVQCDTKDPTHRTCAIPPSTAGRYILVAAGNATSTGADATQSLAIVVGGEACFVARPVSFSGTKGMRGACEVTFLTDQAVTVGAVYRVTSGTPDVKGPQLIVRRLPWNGIVEAKAVMLPAAGPAAAGKPAKK